jgi:two-component system, OmpR family, response regulator
VTKHVLVVEHDADVREIIGSMLVECGYRVSLAVSGNAMQIVLDRDDPVDVLMLDATLRASRLDPAQQAKLDSMRLVMMSGNIERIEVYQVDAYQLLRKPFTCDELDRAVQHALGSDVLGQRKQDPD